jgi:hypothetical protein
MPATASTSATRGWCRRLAVAAMALLGSQAADLFAADRSALQPGPTTMTTMPSTEIHAGAELLGFWPFVAAGQVHVGVLERELGAKRSALTILALDTAGTARVVRRVDAADTSIHAADARVVGADLVLALETNLGHALQLVSSPVAALVDPAQPAPGFLPLGGFGLSPAQQAGVVLPAPEQWNVADTLAPSGWLFSPRLTLGLETVEIIANTADGQAVRLAGPAGGGAAPTGPRVPGIPGAAGSSKAGAASAGAAIADAGLPQALVIAGRRLTAFLRFPPPYRPFWALPRYGGPAQPAAGQLAVLADGDTAPRNLSADPQLGPVIGFSLILGSDARPTLLALRRTEGGVRLAELNLGAGGWTRRADLALSGAAERVAGLVAPDRSLAVVYAVRLAGGWSLRWLRSP